MAVTLALCVLIATASSHAQAAGTITTIAGTGGSGFSGDGGLATLTTLDHPQDVAIDPDDGSIYISDTDNNRIRRIDAATGIITTVAGGDESGFDREPLPALDAHFRVPRGIAFDADGNLYVADQLNNRIRRIDDEDGLITTVAGDGRKEPNGGGDNGAATAAPLHHPSDIAFDAAGNLYITDTYANLVRKVDPAGIITTVAGVAGETGEFSPDMATDEHLYLSQPQSVAVDPTTGAVYVADSGYNRVVRINPDKTLSTVAGIRTQLSPQLWVGLGLVPGGYPAAAVGDGGAATNAVLFAPMGIGFDAAGRLHISESTGHRMRIVDADGLIHTVAGTGQAATSGDGGPASVAGLYEPFGFTFDSAGNLLIAQTGANRIRRIQAGYSPAPPALEDAPSASPPQRGSL